MDIGIWEIGAAIFAVMVILAVLFGRKQGSVFTGYLSRQADKRDGKFTGPNLLWPYPKLTLNRAGVAVHFSAAAGGGQDYRDRARVYGAFTAGPRPFRLWVSTADAFTKAEALLGFTGLALGDAAFDRRFKVSTNDETLARRILDPAMAAQLSTYDRADFDVNFRDGRCNFRVYRVPDSDADYDWLIDSTLMLCDRVAQTR